MNSAEIFLRLRQLDVLSDFEASNQEFIDLEWIAKETIFPKLLRRLDRPTLQKYVDDHKSSEQRSAGNTSSRGKVWSQQSYQELFCKIILKEMRELRCQKLPSTTDLLENRRATLRSISFLLDPTALQPTTMGPRPVASATSASTTTTTAPSPSSSAASTSASSSSTTSTMESAQARRVRQLAVSEERKKVIASKQPKKSLSELESGWSAINDGEEQPTQPTQQSQLQPQPPQQARKDLTLEIEKLGKKIERLQKTITEYQEREARLLEEIDKLKQVGTVVKESDDDCSDVRRLRLLLAQKSQLTRQVNIQTTAMKSQSRSLEWSEACLLSLLRKMEGITSGDHDCKAMCVQAIEATIKELNRAQEQLPSEDTLEGAWVPPSSKTSKFFSKKQSMSVRSICNGSSTQLLNAQAIYELESSLLELGGVISALRELLPMAMTGMSRADARIQPLINGITQRAEKLLAKNGGDLTSLSLLVPWQAHPTGSPSRNKQQKDDANNHSNADQAATLDWQKGLRGGDDENENDERSLTSSAQPVMEVLGIVKVSSAAENQKLNESVEALKRLHLAHDEELRLLKKGCKDIKSWMGIDREEDAFRAAIEDIVRDYKKLEEDRSEVTLRELVATIKKNLKPLWTFVHSRK